MPEPLRARVTAATDPLSACKGADALLVMTPWPEFREVALERVAAVMRGRTLIDPSGVVDADRAAALGFSYYRLGAPSRARSLPC